MPWNAEQQRQARLMASGSWPKREARKTTFRDVLRALGIASSPLDLTSQEPEGVRPDYGMTGAGLQRQRAHPGEYLPGEATQADVAGALWNIVESAGVENLPGIGPHKMERTNPASRRVPSRLSAVDPMFEAAKVQKSFDGKYFLVDRRGNWDSTPFDSPAAARAAMKGVEVPLAPITFERAYAGRGDANTGDGGMADYSRYGPGEYWADNRRVAEIFQRARPNGRIEEGTTTLRRPFDALKPNVHAPEFRTLAKKLNGMGYSLAQIQSAMNNDPVDSFSGLARLVGGSRDSWAHAPKLNALLREAGYDGVLGRTRDSPDLPDHSEMVLFK